MRYKSSELYVSVAKNNAKNNYRVEWHNANNLDKEPVFSVEMEKKDLEKLSKIIISVLENL